MRSVDQVFLRLSAAAVLFGFYSPAIASPLGPLVLSSTPSGSGGAPASSIRFIFDRSLDPTTFTASDIVSFTGPGGALVVTGITPVPTTGNQQWDVQFSTQALLGAYSMTIGPDIRDPLGNPMDQNGNGITGEIPGDRYTAGFSITAPTIVSSLPFGNVSGTVGSLRIFFDRSMDPVTFTPSDIFNFLGPGGAILPTSIGPVSGTSNQQFDIGFSPQTAPGLYSMTIGPDVQDFFGNRMDQNGNGIPGEIPGDRFLAQFTINQAPEPGTCFLFGAGLLLLARVRKPRTPS